MQIVAMLGRPPRGIDRRVSGYAPKVGLILALGLALSTLSSLVAQAETITSYGSRDTAYGIDATSPFRGALHSGQESVDPLTGALSYSVTDLTLKGRGGLDLVIGRTYSSKDAALQDMQRTATLTNGTLTSFTNQVVTRTWVDRYGLGVGWRLALPYVEFGPDATTPETYIHMADGSVYKTDWSWPSHLRNYYLLDREFKVITGVSYDGRPATWQLTLKSGTKHFFSLIGNLIATTTPTGEAIYYRYQDAANPYRLTEIQDSVGRIVSLTYNVAAGTTTVACTGDSSKEVVYTQAPSQVSGLSVLYKASTGVPGAPSSMSETTYEYDYKAADFDLYDYPTGVAHQAASGISSCLSKITYPDGGQTAYTWGTYRQPDKVQAPYAYTPCVTKRQDLYAKVGTVETVGNERQFTYAQKEIAEPHREYSTDEVMLQTWDTSYGTLTPPFLKTTTYFTNNSPSEVQTKGLGFEQTVATSYSADTKMPYKSLVKKYGAGSTGSVGHSEQTSYFAYDAYGNRVLSMEPDGVKQYDPNNLLLTTADPDGINEVSSYRYDYELSPGVYDLSPALKGVLQRRRVVRSLSDQVWETNTTDTMGRLNSKTESLVRKASTAPSLTYDAPGVDPSKSQMIPALNRTGMFWNWVVPDPVESFSLQVSWSGNVSYSIWIRPIASDWGTTATYTQAHSTAAGTDGPVNLSAGSTGFYEVKVVLDQCATAAWVLPTMMKATCAAPTPFALVTGEARTTNYTYSPSPSTLANITNTAVAGTSYQTNYSYDTVYSAFLSNQSVVTTNAEFSSSGTAQTSYAYDSAGRRISITDGNAHATTFEYDWLDRVTKETTDGKSKRTRFLDSARRVEVADEENTDLQWGGPKQVYLYDMAGNVIQCAFVDLGGAQTVIWSKQYNSQGRLWKHTDYSTNPVTYVQATRTTTYQYDAAGRVTKTTFPDNSTETTVYSDELNKRAVTDAKGATTIYTYDKQGHLLSVKR